VSGFAGGNAPTAHYKIVGTGTTEHAESLEVTYDPSRISYGKLLEVFFSVAHPTELNRHGPDEETQYGRDFSRPQSQQSLHCVQRCAEGEALAAAVSELCGRH
jgi:peptide methionine sulfoxide reductase MsrA